MVFLSGFGRGALTRAYRRLPARLRTRASEVIHGETAVQLAVNRRLRAVASKVHVDGQGDQVVGGALRPYRAVTVTQFDAWEHVAAMRDAVVTALKDASIDVLELPNQPIPLLVVSSSSWTEAWTALMSASALSTFWVEGSSGRQCSLGEEHPAPPSETLFVFQKLRGPRGEVVADQRIHIRLECWTRVTHTTTPRLDGGFHAMGTLLSGAKKNTFASHLSPMVQVKLRAHPSGSIDWLPSIDLVTQPVDIVYTWVDGSDPVWLAKKAEYVSGDSIPADSQISARFENRDELRHSLRSVEMYASWYNHIFLVTDGQIPEWLNTEHPGLTVVDHRDLFDASELPVFNSHAIESRLHRIAGLSELFLYLNDDVFFGRPVRPELFFTGVGHPKFFPSTAHIDLEERNDQDISVTAAAKNNRRLLEQTFGKTFFTKMKHTPYAHSKRLLQEMEQRFPGVFHANVSARFRSHNDHSVLSSLAQWYGAMTGRASMGVIQYNYTDVSREDLGALLAHWRRNPVLDVFCLNDTGRSESTTEQQQALTKFMHSMFPLPSRFEL